MCGCAYCTGKAAPSFDCCPNCDKALRDVGSLTGEPFGGFTSPEHAWTTGQILGVLLKQEGWKTSPVMRGDSYTPVLEVETETGTFHITVTEVR